MMLRLRSEMYVEFLVLYVLLVLIKQCSDVCCLELDIFASLKSDENLRFHSAFSELGIQYVIVNEFNLNKYNDQDLVFLVDLDCLHVTENLLTNSASSQFSLPLRWIFFGQELNESFVKIIPEVIKGINVLIDSEVAVIRRVRYNFFNIYYIYKICSGCEWEIESYGFWNFSHGITSNMNQMTALRRLNLHGQEIKISYVLTNIDSIKHLTDGINDHIDTITKANFLTTNYLLDFLNASRKYVYTETWGYRQNNTWTGMSGHLTRGEVDIGGSPMFFTSERLSIVEYISSPTPTRSKFEPKLSYENNLFLLSFEDSLWYGSLGLIGLVFIVLCIATGWEWRKMSSHQTRIENAGVLRANIIDIALLIFGATCQQGSPVELKGSLGRLVLLLLFVSLTFLYTSFSANIVALLQSSSTGIKTLEDLLRSRIKLGVDDTVYNRYYFSTEIEPVRKAIYEKKVAPVGTKPRFMSMEDGVKEIRKGLFAFHMETGVGYKFVGKYFQESEKCGIKEIQYLRVIDPWLAVRKNTPYMEMFKIGTKRLQEHGLQQRENQLFYQKRPKCSGRQANFVSVSMVDCYPAILVLSYGTIIAVIFAIIEILYHKKHEIIKMKFNKKPT